MKTIKLVSLLLLFLFVSCSTVNVNADYDKNVDFATYKTYAFYKTGIDKVAVSDLDKRRILHAIEEQMTAKGFTKSETPDLLVNINTKVEKNISVNQFQSGWGYGWGFGWNPYFGMNHSISTSTDGVLTIDLIDAKKKELIWQGEGIGYLTKNVAKKDERINEFVTKIMTQYPPVKK